MKNINKPNKVTKFFKFFISNFFQALNRREGLKSLSQRLSSNRDLLNADPSTKVNTILEFHEICSNYQKNWMQWRDVSTRATGTSVVTPKFWILLLLFQPEGGGADFARHCRGCTNIFPVDTYTLLQKYRHTRNLLEIRVIIKILAQPCYPINDD